MSAQTGTAIQNEQIRLAATLFNNIAVAFIVAGVIVPLTALTYQSTTPRGPYWIAYAVLWVVTAALIHQIARQVLTRITP